MYDGKKIIGGLLIFLVLVSYPVWYGIASGEATSAPELTITGDAESCVEATAYMRSSHMDLLFDWRESVVRDGIRVYVASDGNEYDMSLTGTCMSCHTSKASFCDQCHNYMGQKPACWDCHVPPEENE